MKNLIFFLLVISSWAVNAQEISGKTDAGKKIMLNIENNTWRYANSDDGQKPCYTNHTGDVVIVNKTANDIYFYYWGYHISSNTNYKKIKAYTSDILSNFYTVWGEPKKNQKINYSWKVSYELYDDVNSTLYRSQAFEKIKGFETGSFILNDCGTETITID